MGMMRFVSAGRFQNNSGVFMRKMAVAAVFLLALSGCGQKERDELKAKVATLEQQLATVQADLSEKEIALKEAHSSADAAGATLKQCLANGDELKARVRKVEIERDKLRAELKAGKKRR